MSPGAVLRRRLVLLCACLTFVSAVLGYTLWIDDVAAARAWFVVQMAVLVALPWIAYREVRRAYRGEPPNEHEDVVVPLRVVFALWGVLTLGFVVFR